MELFNAPCDVCENRQRDLDPQGCFKQVSSTDPASRIMVKITGCERFRDQRNRIQKVNKEQELIFFRFSDRDVNRIIRLVSEHDGEPEITKEIYQVIGQAIAREPEPDPGKPIFLL